MNPQIRCAKLENIRNNCCGAWPCATIYKKKPPAPTGPRTVRLLDRKRK